MAPENDDQFDDLLDDSNENPEEIENPASKTANSDKMAAMKDQIDQLSKTVDKLTNSLIQFVDDRPVVIPASNPAKQELEKLEALNKIAKDQMKQFIEVLNAGVTIGYDRRDSEAQADRVEFESGILIEKLQEDIKALQDGGDDQIGVVIEKLNPVIQQIFTFLGGQAPPPPPVE